MSWLGVGIELFIAALDLAGKKGGIAFLIILGLLSLISFWTGHPIAGILISLFFAVVFYFVFLLPETKVDEK